MIYDIIILGNGIISYTTAFFLLQKNIKLKIAIVGPLDRKGSSSMAAGAMLTAFAEITNRTFLCTHGKKKFEMALRATRLWHKWIDHLNSYLPKEQKLQMMDGTFITLNAKSGQLDSKNYRTIVNALDFYEEPYETVDAEDIPGLDPFENSRPLSSLFIPAEGAINSHKMLEALEYILIQKGVTIIHDKGTQVIGVQTEENGNLHASHVLLANGVYAQQFIDKIPEIRNRIPRLLAGMGCSMILQQHAPSPIKHVIRTPNRSGACGLHALPRTSDTLYVGATNNVYFEPQKAPSSGLLYFLMQCVIEQINQNLYNTPFLGWHLGNRPATIDTFPLIGETSIKGLWILSGTYRDGFHQSPLLGEHIANKILGEEGLIEDIFSPERPLIQTMNPEESIEEYLLHYMAATYEHSSKPAKFLLEQGYALAARHKTKKLYEKLETNFGLSPDMVFLFDFDPDPEQRMEYFRDYFSQTSYTASTTPPEAHLAESKGNISF
jgi:glycine/D-amino acid oxidase-like deaminating enzyme